MLTMPFTEPTAEEEHLRQRVRCFLAAEERDHPGLLGRGGFDRDFSQRLARHGWVGMVIPPEYGGSGTSMTDQLVVAEELLVAGAPTGAHIAAVRQTAPMLLSHGTPEQRDRYLPGIARGELGFALGMSEPDSGSDLASVRTRAVPSADGWILNGSKVWTSFADRVDFIVTLCRTEPLGTSKHAGLSQLIVDLRAPGVTVRPIAALDGSQDFCEVFFDDVHVPAEQLLGEAGSGWRQVTSELSYERSGPDRWLSTYRVFQAVVDALPVLEDEAAAVVGRCAAWFAALHALSYGIARAVDAGADPAVEAAVVKDLGTAFEQQVVELAGRLDARGSVEASDPALVRLRTAVRELLAVAPGLTIRGGTTEVLRSIVSKELLRCP